jgi:osmoprotectant transport system substrate-binding protein
MRRRALIVPLAATALLLAGCGSPGSSGSSGSTSASGGSSSASAGGQACAPVAGDQLVVLEDDKGLQNAENVLPALNAALVTAHPQVVDVLDALSATLDTATLIDLNKKVDVDRRTSTEVAAEYLASAGLDKVDKVGDGTAIVVGAPNFSEGATLAALYADALTAAGFSATAQTIGNRETYLPALEKGDLGVVPEYLASLTTALNASANGADSPSPASGDVDATMTALTDLGTAAGLAFGAPSQAQDQNTFAVTQAFAEKYQVTTLSELAEACGGGVTLGGPPECPERDYCEVGLTEKYGLSTTFTALDAGGPLTKAALRQGQVALGLVFSSDADLAS